MVLKYQYPFDLSHYDSSDGYNAPRAGGSNHRGADFNGFPEGTPIPAVAAGTVVENYRSGGLGWLVVLAHPDGAFSGYCHMYQQSPLAIGTSVTRGQILGGIGNTGEYSFGAHLHLTIGLNQSGATGGGSHWIDHTDPIQFITDRLNGDDPGNTGGPTAPTQEEIDEMAATKNASIVRDYQKENAGTLAIALVYPDGKAVKLAGNMDVDGAITAHVQVYGISPTNPSNTALRDKYASQLTTAQWNAFWAVYPGTKIGF